MEYLIDNEDKNLISSFVVNFTTSLAGRYLQETVVNDSLPQAVVGSVIFEKKEFLYAQSLLEIVGALVFFLMGFLSNAGGLGGGGMLIPVLMIFFKLSIFESVPLANLFGLIASLTRFIINFRQKHPNPKKAAHGKLCVEYEIVMLIMPLLYLGTLFGVQIGTVISELALALTLAGTLVLVIYSTSQKALSLYRKENEQKAKQAAAEIEMKANPTAPFSVSSTPPLLLIEPQTTSIREISKDLQDIYLNEASHFPRKRVVNFLITLALLFLTSIIVGNKYQKERLPAIYGYLMIGVFLLYTFYSSYGNAGEIRRIHSVKERDGYEFDANDIKFDDNKSIIKVLAYTFIAGLIGGIVGIGVGIVLSSLFLQMRMLPTVVANTNQYLVLISTLSVTSQFLYMGILNIPYAAYLGLIQLVAAYLGVTQVNRIVKLTGRQSVIVMILTFVLFIALISLPVKYL